MLVVKEGYRSRREWREKNHEKFIVFVNAHFYLFISIILLILLVGCSNISPVQSIQPANTLPSPTITRTPIPPTTITTSTPSSSPTATEIPTLTPSMTPTLTPLPTETPNPVFVWQTDFESGLTGFTGGLSNTNEQGVPGNTANAFYEIVSDPTNSDHGNVYRAVVANFSTFGDGTHRPYPDVYFQIKSGPFAVQLDVWLSQVKPQIRSNWSGNSTWLNLISMKSTADPDYCTFMMVNIEPRNLEAGERIFYATPIVFDYCSDNHYALPINYEVVPEFTFNEWHTVRVNVGQDGSVTLYQDGTLLSAGFLPSSALNRLEIAGGHWGLYGANIEQAEVLNDNIRFDIYPYLSP